MIRANLRPAYTIALVFAACAISPVPSSEAPPSASDGGAPLGKAPTLVSVAPALAPAAGGTSVHITGASFSVGALVFLGSVPASKVASANGGLDVIVPPHLPGVVDVSVNNPGGAPAVLAQAFTFIGDPPRDRPSPCKLAARPPAHKACPQAPTHFSFDAIAAGAAGASGVLLVGDFTGWGDHPKAMNGDGAGHFAADLLLAEGAHEYKFVIVAAGAADRWIADPAAPLEPIFGNSLLQVHDGCRPAVAFTAPLEGELKNAAAVSLRAAWTDGQLGDGTPHGLTLCIDDAAYAAHYDSTAKTIVADVTLPAGQHHAELAVADANGAWAEDAALDFSVAGDAPPLADAGPFQIVHLGSAVILDGAGTRDPGARGGLTFSWRLVSAPAGDPAPHLADGPVTTPAAYSGGVDCATPTVPTTPARKIFTPAATGEYVFGLTVSRNGTSSAESLTGVVVTPSATGNLAQAELTFHQDTSGTVSLAASAPAGAITWYADPANAIAVPPPAANAASWDIAAGLPDGAYRFFAVPQATGVRVEPAAAQIRVARGAVQVTDYYLAPTWVKSAVLYEIFVRQFADSDGDGIGDLAGLTAKLPYLKSLGVNTLWLMPVFASNDHDHGYHTNDYFRVESQYGTRETFKSFVRAAHKLGLRVVIDLAINHTSRHHPLFTGSLAAFQHQAPAGTESLRDWYIWFDNAASLSCSYGYGRELGGSRLTAATGWADIPDINFANPAARRYFFDVARAWVDPDGSGDFSAGVDGLRLDHVTGPDHVVWAALRKELKALRPDLLLLAEVFRDFDNGGQGYGLRDYVHGEFDLAFTFPFFWAAQSLFANGPSCGAPVSTIDGLLSDIAARYSPNATPCFFLENHDVPASYTALRSYGTVACGGDGTYDPARGTPRLQAALTLQATLPNAPQLMYGEELGLTQHRGAMPWNLEGPNNALENFFKALFTARAAHPALLSGTFVRLSGGTAADGLVYAFARQSAQETIAVVQSVEDQDAAVVSLDLSTLKPAPGAVLRDLLPTTEPAITLDSSGHSSAFAVPRYGGRILLVQKK